MATEKKFLRLEPEVLLEWIYDDQNLKQENYKVLDNFNTGIRSYMAETGLNVAENTMFPVDTVIRKYAKVDTSKYNFLKIENYSGEIIRFDTARIHLPSNFSFYDSDYKGLNLRIYTYDFDNKKQYNISSYFYDDTLSTSDSHITLNEEFLYDGNIWGKYIELDIPSIEVLSNQRKTNVQPNIPTPNSINSNLTKGTGLSLTAPIFIEFSFISTKSTVLGTTTYRLGTPYSTSINKSPDFQDVGVSVIESTQGDFFEIYGTYDNDNEEFDDFVDGMISLGRGVRIEFDVSLFEENVLMNTQTYLVTENFAQNLWYRPIISFSNTTAMITVEMKIIDTVDNSQVSRFTSLGLTKNIFKYGKKLAKIDIENAYKPKIYNLKSNNVLSSGVGIPNQLQDINLTKVNYPVITDRIKILATSSVPNNTSDYKAMGLSEIILNPFDNFIKFLIASDVDDDGTATPYNLSKILENSTMSLIFRNDNVIVEKNIYQQTDQNDFENGIVVFKIEETDIASIKKISESNKEWYIVIKASNTTVRTLLYSGKFITYDQVQFVDTDTNAGGTGFNPGDITDIIDNISNNVTEDELESLLGNVDNNINATSNSNVIVFLSLDADVGVFETYLDSINANIFLKRAGGNESCGSYIYLLLNLSDALKEDITQQNGVDEVVGIPFDLGRDTGDTAGVSVDDIRVRVTGFNCATADRLNQQQATDTGGLNL